MTSPAEFTGKLAAHEARSEWLIALGVSLGTALLVVAPFFWLGTASGHDIAFHVSSWLDAAGQWREGIIFPHWAKWANYGFGEPRFIFYPPLSWMLGAALTFVAPSSAAVGVFVFLAQTLAGVCLFALARRFLTQGAALAGAACYAANPYALLVIYTRSDFAELLASALMPLAMLAALELSGLAENRRDSLGRATASFAMVFACVWLSNAPAGVLASYSAALIFAWAAYTGKSWRPLVKGACGLALGFGLTGYYLLPAVYEQRWINIAQILSAGLQPAENFLYAHTSDAEHNAFNAIASNVVTLLMTMTAIAAIAARRAPATEEDGGDRKKLWRVLLLLAAAAAFLMIRPSAIFWEYLPNLRFLQFPWRWAAILAVPYAFFLAAAMGRPRARWVWGAAVIFFVGGTAAYLFQRAWWDTEDVQTLQEAFANGQGFEGTDEYDPIGDDHYNLPRGAPQVRVLSAEESSGDAPKVKIEIVRWTAEERDVRVMSREPSRLALRLLDYPAWRVEVNGRVVTPQHAETTGQMIVPLADGRQRVTARFARTPDRTCGDLLSAGSLLAGLLLWFWPRRS